MRRMERLWNCNASRGPGSQGWKNKSSPSRGNVVQPNGAHVARIVKNFASDVLDAVCEETAKSSWSCWDFCCLEGHPRQSLATPHVHVKLRFHNGESKLPLHVSWKGLLCLPVVFKIFLADPPWCSLQGYLFLTKCKKSFDPFCILANKAFESPKLQIVF